MGGVLYYFCFEQLVGLERQIMLGKLSRFETVLVFYQHPSKHFKACQNWNTSEMPFKWHLAGRSIVAQDFIVAGMQANLFMPCISNTRKYYVQKIIILTRDQVGQKLLT